METFLANHWGAELAISAYLFLALVGTMPAPGDNRPAKVKFYEWAYDFLHIISNKVAERRGIVPPAAPALSTPPFTFIPNPTPPTITYTTIPPTEAK